MDTEKTGKFIAALRKEKNLTQAQLAEKILVSDKAVSRWETGRGFPDINNLEAISGCLDVSVAELLKGERAADEVSREELQTITTEGISLTKAFLNKKNFINLIMGFIAGLIILTVAAVHLASPLYIKGSDGALKVEELSDGKVVAVLDEGVSGYDIERVTDPDSGTPMVFIGCYRTKLSRFDGQKGETLVLLGEKSDLGEVYYYPTGDADELIYRGGRAPAAADNSGGVVTLPRLIYNGWFVIGAVLSVIGIVLFLVFRKRYFAGKVLKIVLLPIAFTVSIPLCLAGHGDEVYNAAYYLSGILLLTIALYALANLALARTFRKR
ncbi:MAG: helix-turn-helix transcriptional regulator [Mogibacterium sp.]|nr:helix-turn-helix transcriptional regulator [Mogibacterium sp.]